jgi:hypothetical protein
VVELTQVVPDLHRRMLGRLTTCNNQTRRRARP